MLAMPSRLLSRSAEQSLINVVVFSLHIDQTPEHLTAAISPCLGDRASLLRELVTRMLPTTSSMRG